MYSRKLGVLLVDILLLVIGAIVGAFLGYDGVNFKVPLVVSFCMIVVLALMIAWVFLPQLAMNPFCFEKGFITVGGLTLTIKLAALPIISLWSMWFLFKFSVNNH